MVKRKDIVVSEPNGDGFVKVSVRYGCSRLVEPNDVEAAKDGIMRDLAGSAYSPLLRKLQALIQSAGECCLAAKDPCTAQQLALHLKELQSWRSEIATEMGQ